MRIAANILVLSVVLLLSCSSSTAQPRPTPAITTKFTNTEIDNKITAYRSVHSKNVHPSVTLQAQFVKDFPNSHDLEWEEAAGIYEVEFEIGRTDYKAYYDTNANLLMYVVEIYSSELPAVVLNAAIAKYPDYKFERDAKKIYKGSNILYSAEMEKGKMEVKLVLTAEGNILKETID